MPMYDEGFFEVGSVGDLKRKYGVVPEVIRLNPAEVPEGLRHLIPLAERWGQSDDITRGDVVEKGSSDELRELVRMWRLWDAHLLEWLAGPESYRSPPTNAYVAFSAMTMAADWAEYVLKRRAKETKDRSNAP